MKEGLGTHANSYKSVRRLGNAINNDRKETDNAPRRGAPPSTTDERHMEQMKSPFELTRSIYCIAVASEVSLTPACVYPILTNSLEGRKFVQNGFQKDYQRDVCSSCHHASADLEK